MVPVWFIGQQIVRGSGKQSPDCHRRRKESAWRLLAPLDKRSKHFPPHSLYLQTDALLLRVADLSTLSQSKLAFRFRIPFCHVVTTGANRLTRSLYPGYQRTLYLNGRM